MLNHKWMAIQPSESETQSVSNTTLETTNPHRLAGNKNSLRKSKANPNSSFTENN
jgi:hypothetical protein